MSSETTPISPARFAEALKDLPLSTLHLKATEIRNSIAHLDYSNEQLKPFADGTEGSTNGVPDQDCQDAIRENEVVIARMQERIQLLRQEVENRGSSWMEFRTPEELAQESAQEEGAEGLVNGTGEHGSREGEEEERSQAWRDGTFQTGRIVNGEVRMDGAGAGVGLTSQAANGGSLGDEALRQAMEERMRALAEEDYEEDGIHL
ncbi:hypothetical protein G7Y89_g5707 [Cudoniella acicularis]|uniref:Uncharacterized protein n=1 Tax=Cudoniella acicularis TaxID=354080 RepID=A0A8H4RLY4_9HELO|nr:hypothetical protein G7Y89_g5707 [Cudoniella acicularis]